MKVAIAKRIDLEGRIEYEERKLNEIQDPTYPDDQRNIIEDRIRKPRDELNERNKEIYILKDETSKQINQIRGSITKLLDNKTGTLGERTRPFLTLLIPRYFGPTLYTKGGRVIWTPYYLINTWLYKRQILQGIRDTLQGLRKYKVCKKSFVWLPWQPFDNMVLFANNCQNDYEKQVIFK